jgi:hypothetical protein
VENGTGLDEDESLLQMRWSVTQKPFFLSVTHGHRWKLSLGPTEPPEALKKQMNTGLPKGKTIVDVFADFMRYLFDSTRTLFISSDQN